MTEYFFDERPKSDWGITVDGVSGGGGWGVGGGESAIEADKETDNNVWYKITAGAWKIQESLFLLDGNGELLRHESGELLEGQYGCVDVLIECQIVNDPHGQHIRCLLVINGVEANENGTLLDQFSSGRLKLFVRWQSGHYPHKSINKARFRINNKISRYYTLPLQGNYVEIGEVFVRDGEIFVNYL